MPNAEDTQQSTQETRAGLQAFGAYYEYDVDYLLGLLEDSEPAMAGFAAAMPLSKYRDALPLEAHFVARITTMQVDDCGACAQLNLRMALEAGVDRALLQTLLYAPETLPAPLLAVRTHTQAVCGEGPVPSETVAFLREHYGATALAELATAITGSRIYPTLKRALGQQTSCEILSLEF